MNRSTHMLLKINYLIFFLSILSIKANAANESSLTIGFGSCAYQKWEQPIWEKISTHNPDLFILMGDNVYIDSADPIIMERAYEALSANPYFSKFRKSTPLIGTWDDHDYGLGDGGKEFDGKQSSKEAFIRFFDYPEINQLEQADKGIFHTRWLTFNKKKIQIILLDTRWYRDPLIKSYLTDKQRKLLNLGPFQPTMDDETTLLGPSQWLWLINELKKPADLKLLISSIPVLSEFSGWETWANFPHERRKLLELLSQNNTDNLLILSGDIHKAEISQLLFEGKKLLEFTSSGLAVKTYPASINQHRLGQTLEEKNFGILNIQDNGKLEVVATIYNHQGKKKLTSKLGE